MNIISVARPPRRTTARSYTDWYCAFLALVLIGYLFIGRSFAYQGLPPLLVGELALAGGVIAFLLSGRLIESLASAASISLALLIGWVVIRTLPYISAYGMDAPRDAVIAAYGAFAFIVIAVMLEDKRRLNGFLAVYGYVATIFVLASPLMFFITRSFQEQIPTMPVPSGEAISMWQFRPGQFGVHLSGAALFALLGLQRINALWFIAFLGAAIMTSATGRGAMLAIVVPFILCALLSGRAWTLVRIGMWGLLGLCVVLVFETMFFEYREIDTISSHDRAIGVRQLLAGLYSMIDGSGAQLSQTKEWRLRWWEIIQDHTLNGPYFWTGKGFGINLADADGFQAPNTAGAPPLRDPHSVHLTFLARGGVPCLVLWLSVCVTWSWMLIATSFRARRSGEARWADVMLFIFGYGLAVVVESTFDIGMAGPMMGIPFWCSYGLGIAAVMIYRKRGPGVLRT